jgi:CPA2 family monovalent cation:H+ antiporter-2
MGNFWPALGDVLVAVAGALLLGGVALRLLGSAIPGYILAGVALGPSLLGFLTGPKELTGLAELGVALLLFAIGLEFSLKRLLRLGRAGLLGGLVQVLATLGLGAGAAILLGLPTKEALVVGAAVALSSTAAVLGLLRTRGELDSAHGRNALGVLLLQDVAVVPLLLFTSFLGGEGTSSAILKGVLFALLGFAAIAGGAFLVGRLILPRLIPSSSMAGQREVGVLIAVLLGLGATWTAHELGLSPALGAFVAGLFLSESPFAVRLRTEARPLKSLFMVVFFTAIGSLVDLTWIAGNLGLVLGLAVAVAAGKLLLVVAILRLLGQSLRTAVCAGFCLAQIGEFSFLVADVASADGVIGEPVLKALVSATFLTLLVTPGLVAIAPRAGRLVARLRSGAGPAATAPHDSPPGVVLVGFGPAGRRVLGSISDDDRKRVTVVDLALANVLAARESGAMAVLGDGTQSGILAAANVRGASTVVVALPDPQVALEIVAAVRELAPEASVVVRCRHHRDVPDLMVAGAEVVDEEGVTGDALARALERRRRS